MMTRSISLALLIALGLGQPVLAQEQAEGDAAATTEETTEEAPVETTDEAEAGDPAEGLDMGTPVDEEGNAAGQPYTREEHGDWSIRCINNPDGADPCQMYQLLTDSDGNPVAEIALFPLPADSRAAAGANIVAPLETFLPAQLTLTVDGGAARQYPFTFCSARPFSPFLSNGCVARVGFEEAAVTQFKRGRQAVITLVPAVAPDQTIELSLSLNGFTAAFDANAQPNPNLDE